MALVRIDICKGKTPEHKKAILNTIREALIESFKITEDDISQRIYVFENENFERSKKAAL